MVWINLAKLWAPLKNNAQSCRVKVWPQKSEHHRVKHKCNLYTCLFGIVKNPDHCTMSVGYDVYSGLFQISSTNSLEAVIVINKSQLNIPKDHWSVGRRGISKMVWKQNLNHLGFSWHENHAFNCWHWVFYILRTPRSLPDDSCSLHFKQVLYIKWTSL